VVLELVSPKRDEDPNENTGVYLCQSGEGFGRSHNWDDFLSRVGGRRGGVAGTMTQESGELDFSKALTGHR